MTYISIEIRKYTGVKDTYIIRFTNETSLS